MGSDADFHSVMGNLAVFVAPEHLFLKKIIEIQ